MAHLLHRSVDSETAALILQLQRDDIEAALSQGDAHENVALQLQMQQLNLVETAHNDYTIAQSISRAVFDDRDLLTEELSAEQQAMRDRQLAQRLPQGADIPLDDSTLTDNSEDDVNHRELSITCVACTNTFPWFDILETPCSHQYCVECLSELFDLSMKDETLYPPRCCRQTIPLDDAKLLLHPKLVRDFQQKSIELDAKDRTYCYDPRCSTFIPAEHITEDVAGCPDCGKRTCVICKAAAHRGDCPRDEDLQQLLQAAEHAGWQRCSSCRRVVDLRSGCNHITCPCGAHFCYVCGAPWIPRACGCPQWDETRLQERAQQIFARDPRHRLYRPPQGALDLDVDAAAAPAQPPARPNNNAPVPRPAARPAAQAAPDLPAPAVRAVPAPAVRAVPAPAVRAVPAPAVRAVPVPAAPVARPAAPAAPVPVPPARAAHAQAVGVVPVPAARPPAPAVRAVPAPAALATRPAVPTARAVSVPAVRPIAQNIVANRQQRVVAQIRADLQRNHECDHERWTCHRIPYRCEECNDQLPEYIYECRQCHIRACQRCRRNRL
ncbi:hypothetical protein KCU92_g1140, partial [Aureobasidium melanogenum]